MKNAKKYRKTIELERLEIYSRKLEITRKHFYEDKCNKGQEQQGPKRSRRN